MTSSDANVFNEPVKRECGSIDFDLLDCDEHKLVFGD